MGLLSRVTFELVLMGSLRRAALRLPPGSRVSVTASPHRALEDTVTECEWLAEQGHTGVPHIAARQVASAAHLRALLERMRGAALTEMLLIAGDAAEPAGPYCSSVELLADLLTEPHSLERIGVAAYPDAHSTVPPEVLLDALLSKQQMLTDAGLDGYAITQMCASASTVVDWLAAKRAAGLTLPALVGVAGAVKPDQAQRIASTIGVDIAALGVDVAEFVKQISAAAEELDITGIHLSTFNEPAPALFPANYQID